MTQLDFMLKHSILARLDAAIEQFEDAMKDINIANNKTDSQMRKSQFVLMQTRREILNVREEAVATLTRLNTFGATLEIMARPEVGVEAIIKDVLTWFLLLTECDRSFVALYDETKKIFLTQASRDWIGNDLRPEEESISSAVLAEVQKRQDIFSSSNMDMASSSYQKGGSWRIPLRVVIGIPLIWNDQLIGAFYGDRKVTSGALSQDMLPLLKLYAAQAAIAIRNAQLFAKFSDKN